MRRRGPGHLWQWLVTATLVATLGIPVFATVRGQAAQPTVHVTVDYTAPTGYSQFSPGISYVDNTLDYPWADNDYAAIQSATSLMGNAVTFQNTPIMAWGLPDPWPDPASPDPTNWTALDQRLQLIVSSGGTPVITLSEAPWWMKGQLQPDGTTLVLGPSDEWATRAFSSRILDDQMGAWLHLVQRVAERYMTPPYNVRYFQVWNELKGYYNPVTNKYDYTTSAGSPDGPNANHGYTYMYNRVYDKLMSVADSLGIADDQIKIGGPYPVIDTWSTMMQSNPSKLTKRYGTFDQRPLDVVKYWLQHKAGAAFITVDANNTNKNNVNLVNASTAAEKLADTVRWIRSLDPAIYPGADSLPVWLGEWYARPYTDWRSNDHSNAVKTYAMMQFLKAGGAVALAWGTTDSGRAGPRLWTDTVKGGGTALPFYHSYKDFKMYFSPGTALYQTTISPSGLVDAVASSSMVMLVNRSSSMVTVSVNGGFIALDPYEVMVMRRSA